MLFVYFDTRYVCYHTIYTRAIQYSIASVDKVSRTHLTIRHKKIIIKYLRSILHKVGGGGREILMRIYISNIIRAGWLKWRGAFELLGNHKNPGQVEGFIGRQ